MEEFWVPSVILYPLCAQSHSFGPSNNHQAYPLDKSDTFSLIISSFVLYFWGCFEQGSFITCLARNIYLSLIWQLPQNKRFIISQSCIHYPQHQHRINHRFRTCSKQIRGNSIFATQSLLRAFPSSPLNEYISAAYQQSFRNQESLSKIRN